MREFHSQLIETIKILTTDFLNSVDKMFHLHKESLAVTKTQICQKILILLEIEQKTPINSGLPIMVQHSYANILQNSIDDDVVKKQYFQKDFELHSSSNNPPSAENHEIIDFSKMSKKKIQKNLDFYRSSQTTKFHKDRNGLFEVFPFLTKENLQKKQANEYSESYNSDYEQQSQFSGNENYQQNDKYKNRFIQTSKQQNMKKKYRSYSENDRVLAITNARQYGLDFTCKLMNIPKKNIARWMKRKDKSDKVRGRKPGNPNMQESLNNWIRYNLQKNTYVTQTQIRNKAKQFANDPTFKASKGWLEKYFRRNSWISMAISKVLVRNRKKNSYNRGYKQLEMYSCLNRVESKLGQLFANQLFQ